MHHQTSYQQLVALWSSSGYLTSSDAVWDTRPSLIRPVLSSAIAHVLEAETSMNNMPVKIHKFQKLNQKNSRVQSVNISPKTNETKYGDASPDKPVIVLHGRYIISAIIIPKNLNACSSSLSTSFTLILIVPNTSNKPKQLSSNKK